VWAKKIKRKKIKKEKKNARMNWDRWILGPR